MRTDGINAIIHPVKSITLSENQAFISERVGNVH